MQLTMPKEIHIVPCCVQKVEERWLEKLHEWDKALEAYTKKAAHNPDDPTFLQGQMRCLEALGEW